MPLPRLYKIKQIKELALRQRERTNPNDAAMIALAGFCHFSKLEISLINVEDLVTEKGVIIKEFLMPERISGKPKNRLVVIGSSGLVHDLLCEAIEWRVGNKYKTLTNTGQYRKLQPESRFFRMPNGEEFQTRINTSGNTDPYTLTRYLKRVNHGEGINIKSLTESFIEKLYSNLRI